MAKITYNLSPFDATRASQGALCVMVSSGYSGATITNVTISGGAEVRTADFYGAGICRVQGMNYILVINSIVYAFNEKGRSSNTNSRGYKLMLGVMADSVSTIGNTVDTTTTGGTTRNGTGDSTTISDVAGQSVVDSLNARDHFAVQALKAMMEKVADPASLSNNEMNFYCQQAYQWAANMMTVAASSRASLTDNTAGTSTATEAIGELSTNTEKLLNNLIVELEKTNANLLIGENTYTAERITIPELNALIGKLVDNTRGNVIYKYRNVSEAESDGWAYDTTNNVWKKAGYDDNSAAYTDAGAETLPTWKYVNVVSIAELPELIQAIKDMDTHICAKLQALVDK